MTQSRRDIVLSPIAPSPVAPSPIDRTPVDPTLEGLLRHAIAIGTVLVVLLPAARGISDTFGWLPLWLLAMPLSAWWALHRFRLPGSRLSEKAQPRAVVPSRRRRPGTQARRRAMPSSRRDIASRAA